MGGFLDLGGFGHVLRNLLTLGTAALCLFNPHPAL